MSPATDLALYGICVVAGIIGALVGVGGGILLIPVLTTFFGIDIRLAIGASIVSIIATSSGAAVAFVREGLTNLRVGMFLEVATASGAVGGALAATVVAPQLLYLLLAAVLALSIVQQVGRFSEELPPPFASSGAAETLRLNGSYHDRQLGREVPYAARRVGLGFVVMGLAGLVSGLLGIGSGVLKVLAMDGVMRLPMKVSTATSNFMIGVTAAASAGIYLGRGDVDARLAAPVALGVLTGALLGARVLGRLRNQQVRLIFVPILLIGVLEMVAKGLGLHLAFLG